MRFKDKLQQCTLCPELAMNRNNVVIGDGPIPCSLVFLGEAPGQKEDERGTPFVGTSGTHLRTVAQLIGLDAGSYHILNMLKCRPPNNRDPLPEEMANCRPYLLHQLKSLKPKVVVPLGRYALSFALNKPSGKLVVSEHVGKILRNPNFPNIKFVGTYHPAFVLRKRYTDVEKAFRRHLRKAKRLAYEV